MKTLDISNTDLSSVEPTLLARAVTQLETVELWNTQLTTQQLEAILTAISRGTKLKSLNLSANRLHSLAPELLARAASRLETVKLVGGLVTSQQAEAIFTAISGGGSGMKDLDISNNDLLLIEPLLLAQAVNKLETVGLWRTHVTTKQAEAIFTGILAGGKLENLNLSHNSLSSVSPWLMARAVDRLETTKMQCTPLTGRQTEAVFSVLSGDPMSDREVSGVNSQFPIYTAFSADYVLACHH